MIINIIFAILPLICAIVTDQVAYFYKAPSLFLAGVAAVAFSLSLLTLFILYKRKFRSDLSIGIALLLAVAILLSYAFPAVSQSFYPHVIEWMYASMALVAFLPLLGVQPFTFIFSKWGAPKSIQATSRFRKINTILAFIWGLLFIGAIVLSLANYSSNIALNLALKATLPIILLVAVGLPATIFLPRLLNPIIYEKQHFKSIQQLFEMLPFGFNTRYAKAINTNAKVAFILSGHFPYEATVVIERNKCTLLPYIAQDATCTVKCDSDLWLAIANQEIDAVQASISGTLHTEGDTSIMLHFQNLFTSGLHIKPPKSSYLDTSLYNEYKEVTPLKAQKVTIFYSGERTDNISKTFMMVDHLMKGISDAGAEVNLVRLKSAKIHTCVGCYQCWTKTPGHCIFNDDMTAIRDAYRSSDWVIMASPLFIFTVNGLMKTFMDRLLPILKPYMAFNKAGDTIHPDRFPELGEQRILMVSAGGFPDVKNNFTAMSELIKLWTAHSQNAQLAGEMYLPAAEMVSVNHFTARRKKVQRISYEIGQAIVKLGYIPVPLMQHLSDVEMSKEQFHTLANTFWGNLDGQEAFLNYAKNNFSKD